MSGDIGRGATKQTISYAIHLASTHNRPHGTCCYLFHFLSRKSYKKKAYPHHAKSIEFFSISKKKFQLLMDIDYLMELF
jgi:hypothetical protein